MPKLLAVVRPEPGVGPTSATEIGEALELLFGQKGPFRILAMTNTDWDAAGRQLPGVLASVVGLPQLHLRRTDYLMRSQMTAILAGGLAAFYFSSIRYFIAAGALLTVGLVVATATTLLVIPAVLERWTSEAPRATRSSSCVGCQETAATSGSPPAGEPTGSRKALRTSRCSNSTSG